MKNYIENDFKTAKKWLDAADAVLVTASNGLSIAEGYNIFADDENFKRYFCSFREKYGADCLIRGVFTPMEKEDKEEYMNAVHKYLIDDYSGSEVFRALFSLVEKKPYFVVTCNGDTHFQINGFDSQRIFEAEGNFDGLGEGSPERNRQLKRFSDFAREFAGKNTVLFELGIGKYNRTVKAPAVSLAAQHESWKFITMNMEDGISVPPSLRGRSIALEGDIKENLERLKTS